MIEVPPKDTFAPNTPLKKNGILLSHDFKENDTYRSAKVIGKEFAELGNHLVNLKKHNKVGFLVSNEAQTALDWFPIDGTAGGGGGCKYNDVVRYVYDQLYNCLLYTSPSPRDS